MKAFSLDFQKSASVITSLTKLNKEIDSKAEDNPGLKHNTVKT